MAKFHLSPSEHHTQSELESHIYLLKMGELMLKGRNQGFFLRKLLRNLHARLPQAKLQFEHGRAYLECSQNPAEVKSLLQGVFGLSAAAAVQSCSFQEEDLCARAEAMVAAQLARHPQGTKFKVAVRRVNKSLPQRSYHYACLLGSLLCQRWPQLRVDLNHPDWVLHLELRQKSWFYLEDWPAAGGLPYGVSGRGLLLLSGGIDSPVAGYLMAKRGLAFDMIYFDTPPYTDPRAREKVEQLAQHLAFYGDGRQSLCVFPFTPLQLAIKQNTEPRAVTLMSRALMVQIAGQLAQARGLKALISGESLAQVASQTLDNMRFTASTSPLPMLRPLLGLDKQEIIDMARRIGSYPISIRPFDDCCSVFATERPILHAHFDRAQQEFAQLPLQELMEQALSQAQWQHATPNWYSLPRAQHPETAPITPKKDN